MPLIKYVDRDFSRASLGIIKQANEIIEVYAEQGYDLTLRQLYYQFVSRDLIANKQSEYKRLGSIVNDARLAGLIDWNSITDRTRNLQALSHWKNPAEIVRVVSEQYRLDKWSSQNFRIEVWIEKDALTGVFDRICTELDVPYFSCRGYTSQSEMWAAAQRLISHETHLSESVAARLNKKYPDRNPHKPHDSQSTVILHFGDHDPSGIDMTRDIADRLRLFGSEVEVKRLALTRSQIDEYQPPPNPAKVTDSRYAGYAIEHGEESWELDALEPDVLATLVRDAVAEIRDEDAWAEVLDKEDRERDLLGAVSSRWPEVAEMVAV